MSQVAQTIYSQLGSNKFSVMTGAKMFASSENSLSFKIGRNKTSCNYVKIVYNYGKDLYTMQFCKLSIKGLQVLKQYDDVYCDMLQELFTNYTGLYTRL